MALHLPREDALSVLDGIGHRDMSKWNDEKIVAELGRIPESIEDDFELEGDDDLTLRDILAEIEGGKPCIIVGSSDDDDDGPEEGAESLEAAETGKPADDGVAEDDEDDSTENETKAYKAAERDEKKAAKEEAKTAKAEVRAEKKVANPAAVEKKAKDAFGFRVGTKASNFAACLSDEPKSMDTLLKESGIEKQQYGILKGLVDRGLVNKTEDRTYVLSSK